MWETLKCWLVEARGRMMLGSWTPDPHSLASPNTFINSLSREFFPIDFTKICQTANHHWSSTAPIKVTSKASTFCWVKTTKNPFGSRYIPLPIWLSSLIILQTTTQRSDNQMISKRRRHAYSVLTKLAEMHIIGYWGMYFSEITTQYGITLTIE